MPRARVLKKLVLKELRSLFRDRNILLYGVLLPLFLYPALLFGVSQIKLYNQGLTERARPVVALASAPQLMPYLQEHAKGSYKLQTLRGSSAQALEDQIADLIVTARPGELGYAVEYDSTRGASLLALERLRPLLQNYQQHVEMTKGRTLGISEVDLRGPEVRSVNVADAAKTGRYLISIILPLILIVMCTFGATYPALELTAGERENFTAETTMLLPVSRHAVALAKCIAVTAASFLALVINLIAMLLSAGPMLASLQGATASLPSIAWMSIPWLFIFGLLISTLCANVFLLVGSFAKNSREAQAYATPVQVAVLAPALCTLIPGSELTIWTAAIPVYNAGLLFRAAFQGEIEMAPLLVSAISMGTFSWICFRLCVRRLSTSAGALGIAEEKTLMELHQ